MKLLRVSLSVRCCATSTPSDLTSAMELGLKVAVVGPHAIHVLILVVFLQLLVLLLLLVVVSEHGLVRFLVHNWFALGGTCAT